MPFSTPFSFDIDVFDLGLSTGLGSVTACFDCLWLPVFLESTFSSFNSCFFPLESLLVRLLDFLSLESFFFLAEDGFVEGVLLIQSEEGDSWASRPVEDEFLLDFLASFDFLDGCFSSGLALFLDEVLEALGSLVDFLDVAFSTLASVLEAALTSRFFCFASVSFCFPDCGFAAYFSYGFSFGFPLLFVITVSSLAGELLLPLT